MDERRARSNLPPSIADTREPNTKIACTKMFQRLVELTQLKRVPAEVGFRSREQSEVSQ